MDFALLTDIMERPACRGVFVLAGAFIVNLLLMSDTVSSRALSLPGNAARRMIDMLEQRYNRPDLTLRQKRGDGVSFLVFLILFFGLAGAGTALLFGVLPFGWVPEAMLAGTLLLLRHIDENLVKLGDGLARSPAEGRNALAGLEEEAGTAPPDAEVASVVRDASAAAGVQYADGVVGPVLWYALLGLPGLAVFKAIDVTARTIATHGCHVESFGAATLATARLLRAPGRVFARFTLVVAACFVPGTRMTAAPAIEATLHALTGRSDWPDAEDLRAMRNLILMGAVLTLLLFVVIACYLVPLPLPDAYFA